MKGAIEGKTMGIKEAYFIEFLKIQGIQTMSVDECASSRSLAEGSEKERNQGTSPLDKLYGKSCTSTSLYCFFFR
jgi:hypothetical protein